MSSTRRESYPFRNPKSLIGFGLACRAENALFGTLSITVHPEGSDAARLMITFLSCAGLAEVLASSAE